MSASRTKKKAPVSGGLEWSGRLPTLEEARSIVVPGRAQDPTGRSFKAKRLWGVDTGGEP